MTEPTQETKPETQMEQEQQPRAQAAPASTGNSFAILFLVVITYCLIFAATCGIQWVQQGAKPDARGKDSYVSTGLWKQCVCVVAEDFYCHSDDDTRAAYAFSIIALALEGIAVLILLYGTLNPTAGFIKPVQILLHLLIVASLVITFSVFYQFWIAKDCEGPNTPTRKERLSDFTELDFSWGIRVAEFAVFTLLWFFWIVAAVKGIALTKTTIRVIALFTIGIMSLTYISTTSHMWSSGYKNGQNYRIGVYKACTGCISVEDIVCPDWRAFLRNGEAFSILSIIALFILLVFHTFAVRVSALKLLVSFLAFVFLILSWIPIAALTSQDYCQKRYPGDLHWGFALAVSASGFQFIHFIIHLFQTLGVCCSDKK